jgi:predicted Zn-ribbon and HTH transcriptional regulator
MFGLSNSAFEAILHLFSLVLPEGHCILDTLDKVRKVVRDLGLDYQMIDACFNDCVLFRKSYANLSKCPTCGESRWKVASDEEASGRASTKKCSARKILRYFSVIPLL